jgi:hypothetical protein
MVWPSNTNIKVNFDRTWTEPMLAIWTWQIMLFEFSNVYIQCRTMYCMIWRQIHILKMQFLHNVIMLLPHYMHCLIHVSYMNTTVTKNTFGVGFLKNYM